MKDYTVYFDIDDTLSQYSENIKRTGLNPKDTAKDKDFWVNAEVMDGSLHLFKFCKHNFKNVEILSAVPSHSSVRREETGNEFYPLPIEGKKEWLSKHFGSVKSNWTKNGKDKQKFADKNSILIDDKMDNIKHFNNAGGIGILFQNSKQVMEELEELLVDNPLNEGFIKNDYKEQIKGLTMFALNKGMNIQPLPRVVFKHNDVDNAENFIGRTAYYDPNDSSIILFTSGRDPISIVNSFSHELIHHIQNLEGRLTDINSENIHEDDYLEEIEREAYEGGGMLLRNYKDHLRKQGEFSENMITEEYINFNELEKELDLMLEPIGLDAAFTKHFKERCRERNLSEDDIEGLVSKVIDKYGGEIADLRNGENRVFTDTRKLIDLATVGGTYNDDYLKDLIFKTAYKRGDKNEPEFRTNSNSPKLKVEEDKFGLNMFMRELINELANPKSYTIYQDLDGPITDFDGQFKKYSGGIEPGDYEKEMGKEAFWELIDNKIGLKFWTEMPWASDGHKLWDYIKEYSPTLLSAPSRNVVSSNGKKEWVKNELPGVKLILSYADQKRKYADERSILIDDRERNVEEWIQSGGIGILWVSADDTIKQLKELGL